MGRVGEPAELAASIAFLVSDEASYINGTSLTVDGGSMARCFAYEPAEPFHRLTDRPTPSSPASVASRSASAGASSKRASGSSGSGGSVAPGDAQRLRAGLERHPEHVAEHRLEALGERRRARRSAPGSKASRNTP